MSLDTVFGPNGYGNGLAADANSLAALKYQANTNSAQAIKETAQQFASLFNRELIKSMRDTTMKSGMLDNAGTDLGNDLLDDQLSLQMARQPGGIADVIAKQLAQLQGGTSDPTGGAGPANGSPATPGTVERYSPHAHSNRVTGTNPNGISSIDSTSTNPTASQASFVDKHLAEATQVETATGIPANFMLGQAGHETGWGKHEIKQKNGSSAHNLFGIKAGPGWTGKVAEVTTTEYVDGVAQKRVAKFRAYDSYADSFKDYAHLITQSPRFAQVKMSTGSAHAFASGLQRAGYATDPEYAAKVSRAISTTQQLRRVQT